MLACLSLALVLAAEPPLVVHAEGPWPFAAGPGKELILRSPAELAAASGRKDPNVEAELAKALKVKAIDWKKQMVIVLRLEKIHPSHSVFLYPLTLKEGALTVRYYYWQLAGRDGDPDPKPADVATAFFVDRFDGKATFKADPRMPK